MRQLTYKNLTIFVRKPLPVCQYWGSVERVNPETSPKRKENKVSEAVATRGKLSIDNPTEAHESLRDWLENSPNGPQISIPIKHVSALVLYHHVWQNSPERVQERRDRDAQKREAEKAERARKEEERKQKRIDAEEARKKREVEAEEKRAQREKDREAKEAEREQKLKEADEKRAAKDAEREQKAKEREEKRAAAEAEREQKAKEREEKRAAAAAEKEQKAKEREAAKAAKAADKTGADGDDSTSTPANGNVGRGALRESKQLKRKPAGQSAGTF